LEAAYLFQGFLGLLFDLHPGIYPMRVTLKVDVGSGDSWREAH